jgi:hypothetical protein
VVRLLYMRRREEHRHAVIVLLQRQVRRFMVHRRLLALKEIVGRGRLNRSHAAILLQQTGRRYLAWKLLCSLRNKHQEWVYVLDTATRLLQKWLRDCMVRIKAARASDARRLCKLLQLESAQLLQRVVRGFLARQVCHRRKIQAASRWFAATLIQRIYRGSRILHWRDIRLNSIAAFVLDRHSYERNLRSKDCMSRYSLFQTENRVDSASEDEEEDEVETEWVQTTNPLNGISFWYHTATNEKTYIQPTSTRTIDLSYVGLRVRILWVVQDTWYEGYITRFNARKRKYRIEYDDGDHEWMNMDREASRMQFWYEGAWLMKQLYVSSAKREDTEKAVYRMQEREAKRQAFLDARQWVLLKNDLDSSATMFMSEISGELRSGAVDALQWEIQEDELGYPLFVNIETHAISFEDPRFTYDLTADVIAQREYVLTELRFTMYFCTELIDNYDKVVISGREKEISRALRDIRTSDRPKQLSALVLRIRALFKQASVLDRPIDSNVQYEIDSAVALTERFGVLLSDATFKGIAETQARKDLIDALRAKSSKQLLCYHCHHETQRHLEFCATCGKKQLF